MDDLLFPFVEIHCLEFNWGFPQLPLEEMLKRTEKLFIEERRISHSVDYFRTEEEPCSSGLPRPVLKGSVKN